MSQVACMRAVAKVAWEVFDGVCGGRRRNVETEGKESSDEASNNVETGAPLYPYEASQAKSYETDPKWFDTKVKSKIDLQKDAREEEWNGNSVNPNSLVVEPSDPKTRRMTDEKREKRKAKKVVGLPEVDEISAPTCGHDLKKLPSASDTDQVAPTSQVIPEHVLCVGSGDGHSSDLATSELWSCKKKEPTVETNREKKRLKPAKLYEGCDVQQLDSLAKRDEKDYIKSFRHRRVMEQLERAEALAFKAKVERMIANQKIFGNNYRTPEQIAHDLEVCRFECTSIYVYPSESSNENSSSSYDGCQRSEDRSLMRVIEGEASSDILDDLIERSKGSYTERRGGARLYASTLGRHARSTKTEARMSTCSGRDYVHDACHCNICMAGLQLEPSALLHQLKENHSMANWTPPFVKITVEARQESGICEAERGFIDAYRQAHARGLLSSPPEDKFLRGRRKNSRIGEYRKRPRRTGRTENTLSSVSLSAEEGRNIGGGGILQARGQRRVGREGHNPCHNNQKLFQEEGSGGQTASLQHRFEPHRTRSFVKALQKEERVI